jgi:hypothetical protein
MSWTLLSEPDMGFSFPSWLQAPGLKLDLDVQKIDGLLRWQEKNISQSP